MQLQLLDTSLGLILAFLDIQSRVLRRNHARYFPRREQGGGRGGHDRACQPLADFLDDRVAAFVGRRHGGDCFLLLLERGAIRFSSHLARCGDAFILAWRSTHGVDFNVAAVNSVLAIAPPAIMPFFVQRYLARGLSFGAVKG